MSQPPQPGLPPQPPFAAAAPYGQQPQAPAQYGPQGQYPPPGQYGPDQGSAPGYGQPAAGSPAPGQPVYGQPAPGQPAYGQPAYGAPAPGQPAFGQPVYGQPAPGQPAYGQSAYGQSAYGQPAFGQPAYGRPGGAPVARSGRISVGRVIGAVAIVWGVAFLLVVLLHWPIETALWKNVNYEKDLSFTFPLLFWVEYTVPFLVGGALALIFLRPGPLRLLVGLAFAGGTGLVELVVIPALNRSEGTGLVLFSLVYAISVTCLALAWLVVRGRGPARVLIGLSAFPIAWLAGYLQERLTRDLSTERALLQLHGTVLAFVIFLTYLVPLAIATWLAAIGNRPTAASPPPAWPAAPAQYPPPPAYQ